MIDPDILEGFVAYQSEDIAKSDLELVHEPCGTHVCDIEATDTLSVLARTAHDHWMECDA